MRGTLQVGGDRCRVWNVALPAGAGLDRSYAICIGDADHLPRRVNFANDGGVFEFSKGNVTTVVAPGP